MSYRVGIIGTGADPEERDRDGYAMAYRHAPGYRRLSECELVACADIVPENAAAFAENFDLAADFADHRTMLAEVDLDVVSVCVPPAAHAEIVVDCAEQGDLEAIHCEKPMATTWGDCQAMVRACETNEVQLTIDHQRRFARPVREAKRLLDEGNIGRLRRLEWSEVNLFDAGSHLFDLCSYFIGDASPTWALAGIEPDAENRWFGALNERRAVAHWAYDDGTQGFASTAEAGETLVDAYLRLVGEDGTIEIQPETGPPLRMRTDGGWNSVSTDGESVYSPGRTRVQVARDKVAGVIPGISIDREQVTHYERAIEHAVQSLTDGVEPEISGRRVLEGTELVFACWESARQQGPVDLPLRIRDNPLEGMIVTDERPSAEQEIKDGDAPEPELS